MSKKLLKSKTFWTGLTSVAGGIIICCTGNVPAGIPAIIFGLNSIFTRNAIAKVEDQIDMRLK